MGNINISLCLHIAIKFQLIALTLQVTYSGWRVFKITPTSEEEVTVLQSIESSYDQVHFYPDHISVGHDIFLISPPDKATTITTELQIQGIDYSQIVENLQQAIDDERDGGSEAEHRREIQQPFDIDRYNSLSQINKQLLEWSNSCPPGLRCNLTRIGQSHQGRPIYAFHLSSGFDHPVIYIDAGVHGREWVAIATILKLLHHMLNNYGKNRKVTSFLDRHDMYLVPVVNPDGYRYTWVKDRMWRKNRASNGEDYDSYEPCTGVDINRNFDDHWGVLERGSSDYPCDHTYCGPYANSEPETQTIVNTTLSLLQSHSVKAFISLHAFGRMMVFPQGYTLNNQGVYCERTLDFDDLSHVANTFADGAMEKNLNKYWRTGTVCETIQPASGLETDWAKNTGRIKYAYTVELTGSFFVTDRREIQASFREFWGGLQWMMDGIDYITEQEAALSDEEKECKMLHLC